MKRIKISTCILICVAALLVQAGVGYCLLNRSSREIQDATLTKLTEAVYAIRDSYIGKTDEKALADAAVSAMVDSLQDQWSYYLTSEELSDYLDAQENRYGGIGLVLTNDADGLATIKKVYEHSPAGEVEIQSRSHFLSVQGKDVSTLDYNAVSELIRVAIEEGSVSLQLLEPDGKTRSITLVPGDVYIDPVSYQVLDSGLGYIRISNFDSRSGEDTITAMDSLLSADVPGIIFDVRENPGGQLTELLEVLDYILPEGDLFIQQNVDGTEQVFTSKESCVQIPMVVLINEDTYSAAEFFAAALSEYDWADTVGAQTTGKGYGQINVYLSDGSAIHISNIAYFTPQRVCLANVGLTPDLSVEMGAEQRADLYYDTLSYEEDVQLQAAEALLLSADENTP